MISIRCTYIINTNQNINNGKQKCKFKLKIMLRFVSVGVKKRKMCAIFVGAHRY